jgi:hypothetical protein
MDLKEPAGLCGSKSQKHPEGLSVLEHSVVLWAREAAWAGVHRFTSLASASSPAVGGRWPSA